MDLSAWHGPANRKTLVILGAGASRGASFVNASKGPKPPLDIDFFLQLQRLSLNQETKNLLKFIREEFGSNTGPNMEEFFSQADYTDKFHQILSVDSGPKIKRYSNALGWFYKSLPMLFKNAIGEEECTYHSCLAKMLGRDDVMMSFNYDCLIDKALITAGRSWDPSKKGYGFDIAEGTEYWKKHEGKGAAPKKSITLLKPHGSFNWNIDKKKVVKLEKKPYNIKTADGRIVPPTWFKSLNEEPYASVWKQARLGIRRCRALIVIGYSVPQTDIFSRALFKAEVGSKEKREKLDLLILANPDREARRRFIELVQKGIESKTRILEFDYFKDLIDSLPSKNTKKPRS